MVLGVAAQDGKVSTCCCLLRRHVDFFDVINFLGKKKKQVISEQFKGSVPEMHVNLLLRLKY